MLNGELRIAEIGLQDLEEAIVGYPVEVAQFPENDGIRAGDLARLPSPECRPPHRHPIADPDGEALVQDARHRAMAPRPAGPAFVGCAQGFQDPAKGHE